MEVREFASDNSIKIVMIPGNMMCWKQFEHVIPLLEQDYHVIAISTDGYDGTGQTTFTTAEASAEKLENYIREHLDGQVDMVFGESFGCATAGMLFHRKKVAVGSLIMSGPQHMNIGVFSGILAAIIPRNQYRLLHSIQERKKLPRLLKLYTRADDEKLLAQFENVPENISLETLRNCTREALALYKKIDHFKPEPEARVSIWYGAKEPNMKKAVEKLKRAFPNAEERPFEGLGHGEIIAHPDKMAKEIREFCRENSDGNTWEQ